MGLMDKIFNLIGYEKAKRTWAVDIQDYEVDLGIPSDESDPDYLDCYSIAVWVYRSVKLIAEQSAGLPLRLFRIDNDKEVFDGKLIELLNRVNPFDTSYNLRLQLAGFMGITGNNYWAYEKDANELYTLRPDRVKIIPSKERKIEGYLYEISGRKISYEPDEVIHFKTFNPYNDYYGLSPLKVGMFPLTVDFWAQQWNKNFFKNSAVPRGLLSTDQELDPKQAKRLRLQWEKVYRGTKRAHRVAVLGKGAKWQDVMKSSKDMDFVMQRKMNREEIIGIYGVPPVLVGIFEYANYANSKEQIKIFWEHTMIPFLKLLESTYDEQLIPKIQKGLYSKHDLSNIDTLKENEFIKSKTAQSLASSIMTINEVRQRLYDLPEVDWGDEPIPKGAPAMGGLSINIPESKEKPKSQLIEAQIVNDKRMSDEDIARWGLHEKRLTKHEASFQDLMKEFFKKQERRILRNFDQLTQKTFVKMTEEEISAVFDLINEIEVLKKEGAKGIAKLLQTAGGESLLELGIDIDFELKPAVEKWVNAKVLKLAGNVNETTKRKIKRTLIQGIEEGQTIEDMRKGIQGVFTQATTSRARTIARTETNSVINRGTIEAWKQSEIVEQKVWLTAPGAETPRHELVPGLNGQTVGLNDFFNVQGEMLDSPGDPSGSPENVINCRCAMISKIKE